MLNMLHKSLSGESRVNSSDLGNEVVESSPTEQKQTKRPRSGDTSEVTGDVNRNQKRKKRLVRSNGRSDLEATDNTMEPDGDHLFLDEDNRSSTSDDELSPETKTASKLPDGTPEWGVKMLEIIQGEFRQMNKHVASTESKSNENTKNVKGMQTKLAKVESQNKILLDENTTLREQLLDLNTDNGSVT